VLLEVEELLRFDGRKRAIDLPPVEEMPERSRRSITSVIPSLERDDRARPAKAGSFEASYRVHGRKAIGQVS
jgi:hypothetical protein